ncbi:peptidoglycan-binding protein [Streptacidiphilus cavernicola]|uniref:Peptidoglycan-binding protein n=1 Tax=Streptacidiphilus cavernicola TaxID=3342716 RepID=A0ABV6VWP0_9ACTN
MARWKALPAELDPAAVEFVGELRRLKDGSGLTQRRLAARTGYSASSWERYLGGRLLPPREAVEALAASAGADPVPLLARHEAAAETWRRGTATAAEDPVTVGASPAEASVVAGATAAASTADDATGGDLDPAEPDRGAPAVAAPAAPAAVARRGLRARFVLTAVVSAALGATVSALVANSGPVRTTPPAAHSTVVVASQIPYTCTYARRDGLWYAGNSSTVTDPLQVDMYGPKVAELQCLLQRAGFSPGGVDGNFGPLTETAVLQAQKALHLDIDGQVGPKTWAALRG